MKRFLAFYGEDFYPRGGMGDFIGSFDSLPEARAACQTQVDGNFGGDWWHVWDSDTNQIVGKNAKWGSTVLDDTASRFNSIVRFSLSADPDEDVKSD